MKIEAYGDRILISDDNNQIEITKSDVKPLIEELKRKTKVVKIDDYNLEIVDIKDLEDNEHK